MSKKKSIIIFWLVPAAPQKQLFSALVGILARELTAPLFEPHVTLTSSEIDPSRAREFLSGFKFRPIRLPLEKVEFSEKFTKTLFVRLVQSNQFSRLVGAIAKGAGQSRPGRLDPHLSLCYKGLPKAAKRELASIIELPFRTVAFDTIKAVSSPSLVETAADVRSWRTVAVRKAE